jgi:Cft2 family RNA processing exonuclease
MQQQTNRQQGWVLRLQELLLILEEYWERSPELRNVPIYQASALARRAMSIYQTYIEMMNTDIQAAFQVRAQIRAGSSGCYLKRLHILLSCLRSCRPMSAISLTTFRMLVTNCLLSAGVKSIRVQARAAPNRLA